MNCVTFAMMPVGSLLFVGHAAQRILKQYGIASIGQLAACKSDMLETLMGKMGVQLWEYANGLEHDPVRSRYDRDIVKSVGNGSTFRTDLTTTEQVRRGIAVLADSVAMRLRQYDLYAGGIQVTVRDPEFHNHSRQKQFPAPTHLMRDLTDGAMELMLSEWKPPSPIRMLTVTAINLVAADDAYEQMNLFEATTPLKKGRQEKLEQTMDSIRDKFGMGAIQFGATAGTKKEENLPL